MGPGCCCTNFCNVEFGAIGGITGVFDWNEVELSQGIAVRARVGEVQFGCGSGEGRGHPAG